MFSSLLWGTGASGWVLHQHTATVLSRTSPAQAPFHWSGDTDCLYSGLIHKMKKIWPDFLISLHFQLDDEGLRSPWVKVQSLELRLMVRDSCAHHPPWLSLQPTHSLWLPSMGSTWEFWRPLEVSPSSPVCAYQPFLKENGGSCSGCFWALPFLTYIWHLRNGWNCTFCIIEKSSENQQRYRESEVLEKLMGPEKKSVSWIWPQALSILLTCKKSISHRMRGRVSNDASSSEHVSSNWKLTRNYMQGE